MAGTINVIVTDANGCTGTDGVTVTENALPTPTISGSLTYCSGSNTTLDAGAGYSSYTWSNSDVTQTSTVNAGTYDVTVIDINGCEGISPSVTVTEFTAPSPVIYGSTTFCSGGSTNLNTDSYNTYLWSNSDATQSTNITSAGSYSVTVTDVNGCISTSAPVTVAVNTFLTPNLSGSLDYCESSTATLDPGAGYSSYSWSTGATSQTLSATETDNPISVTVVDGNGCSGTTNPVSVTERPNPTPVIIGDLEYCNGSDVTLDAGPGYATYLWSNSINTQSNTVNAGAYAVTVSTAYGCMGLSPAVNVVEHANPTPVIIGDNDYCSGSTVILDAGASYSTYNWSNGANTQTTSAPSGTYNVTVVDINNCTGTSLDHVVTEYTTPTPTISGQDSICDGETSTLDAGSGYDSYVWSNAMGGQQVAIGTSGSYNVVVTNSDGCSNSSPFFEITILANPVVNVSNSGDEVFCDSTAININLDAGTHVSYVWNTSETTQTINATSTGTYNVIVTNPDGCSTLSDDIAIIASTIASPVLQLDGDTTFCEGDQAQLYVNNNFYTYQWSSGSTTPTIIANHSDDYWVTVTDEYGCTKQSDTITVIVDEAPIANFNFSSPNMTIDFTDNSSNASSWSWDFDDTNTGSTQNPSHTYSNSGSYFVTLVVSNACGTDEITQQVNVKPVDNISVNELIWSDLDVYPNPSEGIIFINVNEIKSSPIQITILDELGAVVLKEYLNNQSNQIDLTHVATGVYFVQLQLEDSQLIRKILIH